MTTTRKFNFFLLGKLTKLRLDFDRVCFFFGGFRGIKTIKLPNVKLQAGDPLASQGLKRETEGPSEGYKDLLRTFKPLKVKETKQQGCPQ